MPILDPKILEDNSYRSLGELSHLLMPPPTLTVSEFSEQYISLSSDNALPGSFIPFAYQVEMLDVMADPSVTIVSLMLGAQTGKSQMFLNTIAYYIANRPSNIMLVLPTAADIATMKTTKLDPILATTKGVKDSVSKPRGRYGKNNNDLITFIGGAIYFATAGASRTLRSRSVPILMMDEISTFDADTGEGSPLMLARARTKTFGDRKKIIQTSTPTTMNDAIHNEFLQGDQRYYYVPCEHCGEEQTIEFQHLVIPKDVDEETGDIIEWHPEEAYYPCTECGTIWTDADKIRSVSKGRWIPTNKDNGHRSYQISEMYSPLLKWTDTAKSYVDARKTYDLKSFYNTNLGLPWEEESVKVEAHHLQARAKAFSVDEIPEQVVLLTTGTDVQKDRLETQLVGWDKNEGSYVLEHIVFHGNPARPEVWDQLREYIQSSFTHSTGREMRITINLIDSGYLSPEVVNFCNKNAKTMPCKGSSTRLQSLYNQSKSGASGSKLINIDTIQAKLMLNSRVNLVDKPNSPEISFSDVLTNEWYLQFTAEKMVTKRDKGRVVYDFIKTRPRNEALDCYIYAYVAMKIVSPKGMEMRHSSFFKGVDRVETDRVNTIREEEEIANDPLIVDKAKRKPRNRKGANPYTNGGWKL